MKDKTIISLTISRLSYDEVLARIIALASARTPSYVCFANAHMTVEAHLDKDFAHLVNRAAIVAADGMPLVKAYRYLYGIRQQRVAGMDVMASILPLCDREQLPVYLFGSSESTLAAIQMRLRHEHPTLKVAGTWSPKFGAFTPADNQKYIQEITESGARVVLVALGCPKQEKWMATHSNQIPAVLLGIGGAFAVYAGRQRRAPGWMQRWSLEWLYRLAQEPGRMFRRYAVTNTLFIALFLRQWLQTRVTMPQEK